MKRQSTNAVNSNRARMILLNRGGVRNREIAERVGYSAVWVREVIHRFNKGGIEGIEWYPYYCSCDCGPRTFTADVVEQIREVALSSPDSLIGMTTWSLAKLRDYLIEQKIIKTISLTWLGEILRRGKVRLRRTKTWKESDDPDFWPKYRAVRRLYTKPPRDGRVLCVDEFGPLNLQPRPGTCHKGPGRRVKRHRATYKRTGGVRHFLGAYDLKKDKLFGIFTNEKNGAEFLVFLKWLRRLYRSSGKLYIILDNVSYHTTPDILAWAKTHRVRFYYTPTDASWLNRIECHFTALKKFALSNSDFRSHDEQEAGIHSYLTWRNGNRRISLRQWKAAQQRRKGRRKVPA
jgi:transposase